MPPEEMILIPAVFHDSLLYTSLAQASEQEWQPMHRSIRVARMTFMVCLLSALPLAGLTHIILVLINKSWFQ